MGPRLSGTLDFVVSYSQRCPRVRCQGTRFRRVQLFDRGRELRVPFLLRSHLAETANCGDCPCELFFAVFAAKAAVLYRVLLRELFVISR